MEAGQLWHNNPVGVDADAFIKALMVSIRTEISRVYWNVHQRTFYDRDIDGGDSEPPLGIPGMEWWPYYNHGGSPEDDDWDQDAANRPNFSFEGVEVRWYKYFGRSMNVNVVWPAEKWVRWFERCRQTLYAWEYEHRPWHGDPIPYPDSNGVVSLNPEPEDLRHIELMERVHALEAQINCIACVCIDVENGESFRIGPDDWRWCPTLRWVTQLGEHARKAPGKFELRHDS